MFGIYSYPFYILGIIVQILCIIHALKTGRREWLYLLLFLPLAGAVVYFIMELWPEISRGELGNNIKKIFFPGQRIREMERKMRLSDTITNRLNLAEAYAGHKQYDKAISLAKSCLDDPYINHSGIILQLARLFFEAEQYSESLSYLEKAKAQNSYNRLDRPEDELLYARALDYTGDLVRAEAEYQSCIRVHHSLEAMYHYGMLLKKMNRPEEAKAQFRAVKEQKDLHPKYVRRMNARWIRLAGAALRAA